MLDSTEHTNGKANWALLGDPLIVLACDEVYAMPLATTLRSIVEANRSGWPLDFHVLTDGFSEDARRKVHDSLPEGAASISWVPVGLELFRDFFTVPGVSKMTYARLLIPRVFPATVSRVLYLDTDILVLDDLRELWKTDLEGAIVGAVLDGVDPQLKGGKSGLEKVPRVRDYFNAGVLLIELDRWRKEQVSQRALEYLARYPRSPYMDQDGINVVCDGRWKQLDPRWNFQDHFRKRISDMDPSERPAIAHFVTSSKPWKPSSLSLNASFYDAFRRRTCFARTPWNKLRDVVQQVWARLKGVLRRYAFLRTIWITVRGSRRGQMNIEAVIETASENSDR